MPIRNEHVASVFAGVRATYESLAATGSPAHFDFFVLSDSDDPDTLTCRAQSLARPLRGVGGFGPHLLPLAPAPHQAQERQRRGLLPALGQRSTATWWCWTPTAS